jgi:hypothetical protein
MLYAKCQVASPSDHVSKDIPQPGTVFNRCLSHERLLLAEWLPHRQNHQLSAVRSADAKR